ARDASLGREVALKVLPPEVARDRARLERFQREARAVAALNHPNIVTLYSVEEADGVHFLTMELVEGKAMGQLIPTGGITLDRFLDLAIPLADALRAAHERGITHRDLKPANIMVDTEGRVKVLDFGLAKLRAETSPPELSQLPTEALTQEGLVVGTVPYMSPEQVEGRAVDHRSDIFSLGIVLYEMVAGERPFRGDSSAALVSSILRDTPPLVTDLKAEHPAELGRIVRRCLEKDPSHRFQTALDVRNELEDLQKEVVIGKAVGARPRVAPEPAAGPAPVFRHRWPIPVVLAVLAAVVGIYWMTTRIPPRPAGAPQITSLAVLPLENLSGDPEQEYFADGMTEALITDLAKIGTLKVIARASVMPFKEASRPLPEIAQQLGVEGLITGAVLRSGGQIRITAQLIDAASQEHLWADRYEKELRDVLLIQSQIVEAIAGEIELALTPQEQHRLGRAPTIDPQAHDAYLRGRYFLNKGSPAGYKSAIDDFRRALEREPDYAPVHAGLAQAYLLLAFDGLPPV
ncbi:MAG: protein kinase, partial [Gemmatimonadetes bacterium]|nr:protein kinase [Gemmatimonadota bacterium]